MALDPGDVGRGLGTSFEVELGEDGADVVLDRLVRQEDLAGDLLVRLALRDEGKDLAFLLGQGPKLVGLVRGRDPAHPLEDFARHGRVQQRLSSTTASSAATRSRARTCLRRYPLAPATIAAITASSSG